MGQWIRKTVNECKRYQIEQDVIWVDVNDLKFVKVDDHSTWFDLIIGLLCLTSADRPFFLVYNVYEHHIPS